MCNILIKYALIHSNENGFILKQNQIFKILIYLETS